MIPRFLKKIRAGILWVSAFELAAKSEFERALEKLSAIEKMKIGFAFPAELELLRGLCFQSIGESKRAISHVSKAFEHLESSKEYGEQDKKYLLCYGSIIVLESMEGMDSVSSKDIPKKLLAGGELLEVDLGPVQDRLKNNFPIRDHPDWKSKSGDSI